MRPVDSFLQSVRNAFGPSEETPAWAWLALLAFVASIAGGLLLRRRARRRAEEQEFAAFLSQKKLSRAQVNLVGRLAAGAGVPAQLVATQIDVFERATALELARHARAPVGGDEGIFGGIAALRRGLGFQRVAGHFALLNTREVGAGQLVKVAGADATVVEVNEAYLAVEAPNSTTFPIGANGSRVRVTLVHGHEARYEARCVLLGKQHSAAAQRLVLAHDEQPTRIQLRKAVRVTVRGPVQLNPVAGPRRDAGERSGAVAERSADTDERGGAGGETPLPRAAAATASTTARGTATPTASAKDSTGRAAMTSPTSPGEDKAGAANGSLLDISVGGAALETTIAVPVGSLVHISFDLDGVAYRDLLAFVLACQERRPRARHHMRLEFRNLPVAEEAQLASSIARLSAKPYSDES